MTNLRNLSWYELTARDYERVGNQERADFFRNMEKNVRIVLDLPR